MHVMEGVPRTSSFQDHQQLRLRRALLASGAGAAHTLICWLGLQQGYFWLSTGTWWLLTLAAWIGYVGFPWLIYRNYNLKFKDPSLTRLQILWYVGFNSLFLYFAPDMRAILCMHFFVVMLFGIFRAQPKGFAFLVALLLSAYFLPLFAHLILRPAAGIDFKFEFLLAIGFSFILLGIGLVGMEISRLRHALKQRNLALNEAMHKISSMAITDELTTLCNRRHLMNILRRQKGLADRGDYDFTLCFVDLDYFKRINDTFGHQAGDKTLQAVAKVLQASVRDVDYVARLGGEEFVLLLVRTGLRDAAQVAERVRIAIEMLDLSDIETGLKLTVSQGIAQYQRSESIEEVMHRADLALYEAKRCGRNCIITEADSPRLDPHNPENRNKYACSQKTHKPTSILDEMPPFKPVPTKHPSSGAQKSDQQVHLREILPTHPGLKSHASLQGHQLVLARLPHSQGHVLATHPSVT